MGTTSSITPPMPGKEIATFSAPASFAQLRLWFIDRFQPDMTVYTLAAAWRVRGPFDAASLALALDDIVARHEALRTTFGTEEDALLQIVAAHRPLVLRVESLAPASDVDASIAAVTCEEANTRFDLVGGPLLRARLVRIATEDHLFTLVMHHAISDETSLAIIADELWRAYAARRDGRTAQLPELPIQYADFSVWQRGRLRGESVDRLLAYWRAYLAGVPETIALPADRERPRLSSYRGDWVGFELDAADSAALRRLAERCGATLFMVCAALFQTLLYRSTGQADFLIGYPETARDRRELEGLVGIFVNMLVLRARLDPDATFVDVVRRTREDILDGHAHRDLPFEMLIEALQPDRDPARHPLFQVAFAFSGADRVEPGVSGLEIRPLPIARTTAKFDLTLFITDAPDGRIGGGFEYSTDLFHRSTIGGFAARLQHLLKSLGRSPDVPIARLDILPDGERQKLLRQWNPAARPAPGRCVHHCVEDYARAHPEALAVQSADARLTYAELDIRAEALAARLRVHGVDAGEAVGLLLPASAALIVAMVGVLKAGAAYVPLDPQLPAARLQFMVEDLDAAVVVTTEACASRWPGDAAHLLVLDRPADAAVPAPASRAVGPDYLAYFIYTSGSSGAPKAVAISHRGLSALVDWHLEYYASGPADRTTQIASPGFDACSWEVWSCLAGGGALFVVDEETRNDPPRLMAFLAEHRITQAFLPTPLAEAVLDGQGAAAPSLALRTLLTGGDRLHRAPDTGLVFDLVNHYGPTEATVVATAGKVVPDDARLPGIGRAISTARIYVLDAFGEPVPVGAPGEIFIGGAGVSPGYWGRPRLTAERFVPDPFGDALGGRLFRTGDAARYRADGSLEFLGRLDRQIKRRGHRIELGEIEQALARLPQVRCSAVELVAADGKPERLVAVVESDRDGDKAGALWREHLARFLPTYMVPDAFVAVAHLPLLASGKLDRQAVVALARQARPPAAGGHAAPQTPLERQLATIWAEVLGVDRVGLEDNFFALGGHSLLVIQLVARIRSELGIELNIRDVFERASLGQLHEHLAQLHCPDAGDHASDDDEDRETGML